VYVDLEVWILSFLNLAVDGGECTASQLGHFSSRVRAAKYPSSMRLDGPQYNLDAGEEENLLSPAKN
jgi:hypothetical protein